ncbi:MULTISPECIES: hypothetical protein [Thermomonosporaceae]|uniref:hypothetical protein n=1 Tax=Thermomonosporaceae TaxID=2012 RepID=UPI00255AA28F|nr:MULTISPECIES: hypothetical protein [Thermomonosporaceae]MDL4773385.1 hypothetical protein [Actinomadura xylanilytica]
MGDAVRMVAEIRREVAAELRERVRRRLREQSVDWLVEELLTALLPEHDPAPLIPCQVPRPSGPGSERAARTARLHGLGLTEKTLPAFIRRYRAYDRRVLQAEGHLLDPPQPGGDLIVPCHRSPRGEDLLREAKDVLYGLLFGGEDEGVRLDRTERELLTLTVPCSKLHVIAFLAHATAGRDQQYATDDERVLQVEYGEVASELVGNAVAAALRLINHLEINEQVLHGRMENVQDHTTTD